VTIAFQLNNNFMLSSKVRLTDSPVLPGFGSISRLFK
jgi:hypothetical protein